MTSVQLSFSIDKATTWIEVKDGDDSVRNIFNRHYSRIKYKDGRKPKLFVGPGEKMVLITAEANAIFIWRKFISMDKQSGVNCAVFRNEGQLLSSTLIESAMDLAWERWPKSRLYTYVNEKKVKSDNPGYCFKQAGWNKCGMTKSGLVILEINPLTVSRN